MQKIFITFDLPAEVQALFQQAFDVTQGAPGFRLSAESPLGVLAGQDAVIVSATQDRLDRAAIGRLPEGLRAVATYSVGHEHIDLDAARARGLAVLHTPDVLSPSVAEVAMLLLLGAARRVTESIALIRSGRWQGWSPTQLNGVSLVGKRLGIVGMGRIGQETALRARSFGMEIHYANRTRLPPQREQGAQWHASLDALLRVSQCLLLACPVTPQTLGLLNRRSLDLLPPGAIVANVGRGALVVDEDLIEALREGRVAAAGLDVFNGEPAVHPGYATLPNVFMLPHIGSSTREAHRAMGEILVSGLQALQRGQQPSNRIA